MFGQKKKYSYFFVVLSALFLIFGISVFFAEGGQVNETAIVSANTKTFTFDAGDYGRIEGYSHGYKLTKTYNNYNIFTSFGTLPKVIADEGYRFGGWIAGGTVSITSVTPIWGCDSEVNAWYTKLIPSGSGTQDDPWIIKTPENLQYLHEFEYVEWQRYYIRLGANIDMSGESWVPLQLGGNVGLDFDGRGYKITNLKIETVAGGDVGFFNLIDTSRDDGGPFNGVKNLTIEGSITLTDNVRYVGGLAGYTWNSTFEDVHVNFDIDTNGYSATYAGGMFGLAHDTIVTNCTFTGSVDAVTATHVGGIAGVIDPTDMRVWENNIVDGNICGASNVGGIIGNCDLMNGTGVTELTLKNCQVYGVIAGNYISGGIVGNAKTMTIEECVNYATVVGGACVGGIVGSQSSIGAIHLINCVNNGNVNVLKNLDYSSESLGYRGGGIIGRTDHVDTQIIGCFNYGDVYCQGGSAGGLVGYMAGGNMENCLAECDISSGKSLWNIGAGGLVAEAPSSVSTVKNCGFIGDIKSLVGAIASDEEKQRFGVFMAGNNTTTITFSNCFAVMNFLQDSDSGAEIYRPEAEQMDSCYYDVSVMEKNGTRFEIQRIKQISEGDFSGFFKQTGINRSYPAPKALYNAGDNYTSLTRSYFVNLGYSAI